LNAPEAATKATTTARYAAFKKQGDVTANNPAVIRSAHSPVQAQFHHDYHR
jgi:hypothetical protein